MPAGGQGTTAGPITTSGPSTTVGPGIIARPGTIGGTSTITAHQIPLQYQLVWHLLRQSATHVLVYRSVMKLKC